MPRVSTIASRPALALTFLLLLGTTACGTTASGVLGVSVSGPQPATQSHGSRLPRITWSPSTASAPAATVASQPAVAPAGTAPPSLMPIVGSTSSTSSSAASKVTWGMFSVPSSPAPPLPGVSVLTLEFTWASAEPQPGVFDETYFSQQRAILAAYGAAGYTRVVLNFGMQTAPSWLLSLPGARFVNQNGVAWTADSTPNLVFDPVLRAYAAAYTAKVFAELGTSWYAIRVGGGPLGELAYPTVRNDAGNTVAPCPAQQPGFVCPYYWAFDATAQTLNPVPGWLPGQASPNGQAATFLNWYLDSLKNYQNWQIATVRAACPLCPIAVLYPSWGMRPGDFGAAVADNLGGASSAELNGEVQGGRDHQRQILGIVDPNTIVWGTWADNSGTVSWLAGLAAQRGLPLMGENGGPGATSKATALIANAETYGMKAAFWIRYGDPGTSDFLAGIAAGQPWRLRMWKGTDRLG